MTAKGQMPPLRRAERRTIEELFDRAVALRDRAKRNKFDRVTYLLQTAVRELSDILAGARAPRTPPASRLPAGGAERVRLFLVQKDPSSGKIVSLREHFEARRETSEDRSDGPPAE